MNALINVVLALVGALLAAFVGIGGTLLVIAVAVFGVGLVAVALPALLLIATLAVAVFCLAYAMFELFDRIT